MKINLQFQLNLSLILAHTIWFEHKQDEVCSAFNISPLDPFGLMHPDTKVPAFTQIDPTKEQGKAVAGNVQNFGNISKLAGSANTFNQDQLTKMLESAIPGYQSMTKSIGGDISSMLSGEIPKDVGDQIARSGAFKSLAGGFSGSNMSKNLTARDLGLTSLDLINKGIDAGSRWMETAKKVAVAPEFDVTSMFITPEQQVQTKMFNVTGQFQRDWMSNQQKTSDSFWGQQEMAGKQIMSSL